MDDPEALGTLIRSSRLDKGLSLGQLASAVGRSSSSVRRWERGEVTPAATVVPDLAGALDLDEDELLSMVQSAHPGPSLVPDEVATDDATPGVESTIEDDVVVAEEAQYFDTPSPTSTPPVQRQQGRIGRLSSAVFGKRDSWIGWVRGILTALALFFLFMGLIWAFGELVIALREVMDSFSAGTNGG